MPSVGLIGAPAPLGRCSPPALCPARAAVTGRRRRDRRGPLMNQGAHKRPPVHWASEALRAICHRVGARPPASCPVLRGRSRAALSGRGSRPGAGRCGRVPLVLWGELPGPCFSTPSVSAGTCPCGPPCSAWSGSRVPSPALSALCTSAPACPLSDTLCALRTCPHRSRVAASARPQRAACAGPWGSLIVPSW